MKDETTHYVAPLIGVPGPVETYDTSPLEGLTDKEKGTYVRRTVLSDDASLEVCQALLALTIERCDHAKTKRMLAETEDVVLQHVVGESTYCALCRVRTVSSSTTSMTHAADCYLFRILHRRAKGPGT